MKKQPDCKSKSYYIYVLTVKLCLSSAPSSLNVSRYYVISVIFISFYKTDSEIFNEFQLTISIFSELFANYIYTVCIIRKFYESSYESIINY